MRAICNVCSTKDTCSYLKRGRESDCIDDAIRDMELNAGVTYFEPINDKPV